VKLHYLFRLAKDLHYLDLRRYEFAARALEEIGRLWERARGAQVAGNREYNPGWHTALDLPNLLTVSEAITRAALTREESRGAHFREDFEAKSAEWGKFNLVIRKAEDGSMEVVRRDTPATPAELQEIIKEMG